MPKYMNHENKTDLSEYKYKQALTLKKVLWYFVSTVFFTNRLFPINCFKIFLLRRFGAKIGKGTVIKPGVNIKSPWFLEVGDYVWIGDNVWIDNLALVKMADNCCISQGAMLLTGNHNYKKTGFDLIIGGIVLEDGVWLGAKSLVCPGVSCGSHSVLTAGSVATEDMNPYKIYQGNPAVPIRDRIIK